MKNLLWFAVSFCLASLSSLSLQAQSMSQDSAFISELLNDPELAAYALTCRNDQNQSLGEIKISAQATSVECSKEGQEMLLEVINAKPIISAAQVEPLFAHARTFFKAKDLPIFQINQMLLKGRVYLLFYFQASEASQPQRRVVFY